MAVPRIVKAKTKRGKRFLENREPKVIENVKQAIFIKGGKTNECITKALRNFEFLANKNDHSLFMFGFNSKKRANSLVIGRLFDGSVMDMFEFGIEQFKPMEEFKTPKITLGIKPCLIFNGEPFSLDPDFIRLKCLLGDFFRGEEVDNIRLQGLEHVLNFTAVDGRVYMRSYRTIFKKSGTKIPNIELEEIGPSFNFSIRRSKIGSEDLYKESKKQPREIQPKKKKNISQDAFGSVLGRIHMEKQDLSKLQLRKLRAFKRPPTLSSENGNEDNFENEEINNYKKLKTQE